MSLAETSGVRHMRVDAHCHIGQRHRPCQPTHRFSFEPVDQYVSYDAYLSDRIYHGIVMRLAKWIFKLDRHRSEQEIDAAIERILLEHILGATQLDRVVVLAFDQYHTHAGDAIGSRDRRGAVGTDLYVSNTYVRQLWQQYPHRILFGASIHPYRRMGTMTAVDMLDEVAANGAVLVKWLPLTQNIDAEDPRAMAFLRRAGEIGMPMLIHYGGEKVLGTYHRVFEDPSGLLRTLRKLRAEDKMPTVIVAHAATPCAWPFASDRYFRILTEAMLGEFADAPLYADVSGLAMMNRAYWLNQLVRMPQMHAKLVYGSDFPVPPMPIAFWRRLGHLRRAIMGFSSWIDRDIGLKAALGLGEFTLLQSGRLLSKRIAVADACIAGKIG